MKSSFVILLIVQSLLTPAIASAAVGTLRINKLFSDHMVMQRDVPIPIWGSADPSAKVEITIGEQHHSATTDKDGRWLIKLQPMPANAKPSRMQITSDDQTISVSDILVGEVWLCAGQSNMRSSLKEVTDLPKEDDASEAGLVRVFDVAVNIDAKPQAELNGTWTVGTDASAMASQSAVAALYARALRRTLNVPVGAIVAAVGSTRAEFWTSADALSRDHLGDWASQRYDDFLKQGKWIERYPDFRDCFGDHWREAQSKRVAAARQQKPGTPAAEDTDVPYQLYKQIPSSLFNGMIHPIAPYAIRGVVWYQGESNAGRAFAYRTLLPTLIADWRTLWGESFPFLIVQLPRIRPWPDWAELRDAQLFTAQYIEHVGLAVCVDLGQPDQIHPTDKGTVAERLNRLAGEMVYRQAVKGFAPMMKQSRAEAGTMRIEFDHAGGGMILRDDPHPRAADAAMRGFVIAGADRRFRPATARCEGDVVIISSKDVADPKAARYAWADDPPALLWSKDGLPAFPFRTDDWPTLTEHDITLARNDFPQMSRLVRYYLDYGLIEEAQVNLLLGWQGPPVQKLELLADIADAWRTIGAADEANKLAEPARTSLAATKADDPDRPAAQAFANRIVGAPVTTAPSK